MAGSYLPIITAHGEESSATSRHQRFILLQPSSSDERGSCLHALRRQLPQAYREVPLQLTDLPQGITGVRTLTARVYSRASHEHTILKEVDAGYHQPATWGRVWPLGQNVQGC